MPENQNRYYTVEQTREVMVSANSPLGAATLADAAFTGEIEKDDLAKLNVLTEVRQTSLNVREQY